MSFIRSVGLDTKSLTFAGIIGNPRNKKKYVLADRGILGFLQFYPEIFSMSCAFSTFASKVEYSRIKNIYSYRAKCAKVRFSG